MSNNFLNVQTERLDPIPIYFFFKVRGKNLEYAEKFYDINHLRQWIIACSNQITSDMLGKIGEELNYS